MRNLTLLTDLYELTMAYGFYRHKKHEEEAVFDIFFRQNKLITYSLAAGASTGDGLSVKLAFFRRGYGLSPFAEAF